MEATEQRHEDQALLDLDGSPDKSRFGANALLGVSLANAHAVAAAKNVPLWKLLAGDRAPRLPVPMMNILNGGQHADNVLEIQEFMCVASGIASFPEALRAGAEVFHALKGALKAKGLATSVGDEGGFAPDLASTRATLDFLVQAISSAGYAPGKQVFLALDCAASEFFDGGTYKLEGKSITPEEIVSFYDGIVGDYPIVSIEDGCAENDQTGWKLLTDRLGKRVKLIGDDVFVTNPKILAAGIRNGIANGLLVKVNQIGTITETLEAVRMAQTASYVTILSHRSGETEDTTIADLAVAVNAGFIKTGSLCRSERIAKYNRLLRIEEDLGDCGVYRGTEGLL
jgi:enolase